jgi:hypothetical protein
MLDRLLVPCCTSRLYFCGYQSFLGKEQQPGPGQDIGNNWANCKVAGDSEANQMFRREYRKPFVVPERV